MNSYPITPGQISAFNDKGFLLLPNALPTSLLRRWQDLLAELNERAVESYGKSSQGPNLGFTGGPDQPLLTRANDLLAIHPDAVLDLLASPALLAIALNFCGPDAIPLQCDALFKHNHPESGILWHQDALHPRKFPYLNVGIYLDDADVGDGCIDYVANTQHETQDIGQLVHKYGRNLPGLVSVPAMAGDILIQDIMVLHASGTKQKPGVRRTIYVEMRPAAAVLDQGTHSREWMELRRRWMAMVLRRSEVVWPEASYADLPQDLKSDAEEIEQILALREPPMPAHYGLFSV